MLYERTINFFTNMILQQFGIYRVQCDQYKNIINSNYFDSVDKIYKPTVRISYT